jgi:hypothetical protein
VVDAVVVDAAALRAGALRTLDRAITISEGGAFDDENDDLLTPEEEIATGMARHCSGVWSRPTACGRCWETGAVRIDAIDLAAEERGPSQVRANWTVTIKITDSADVRELALAACPGTDQAARAEIEASFAAAWQWAADPCAPMTGIPGVTWTCVEVAVEQVFARSG